eukprot:2815725-Pleurochrysis_carterae.AAC.1
MFGTRDHLLCTYALQELEVLDRQLALNAEMKGKEEPLKKYRLKVVSECKNALLVQRELVVSKETLLSKAKADAEKAGRSAASVEEQLSTAKAASMPADNPFEQVRSELGLLSSKSARRTRGAGMDVHSEEAARRRVALRDEVSAAQ